MRNKPKSKSEFLVELQRRFDKTKIDDVEEIIYDFSEHFISASGTGRTEQDVIEGLGTPKSIVKMYRAEYLIEKAQRKHSLANISVASIAVIGLNFINFLFLAVPLFISILILSIFALAGAGMMLLGLLSVLMQIGDVILPSLISLPIAMPFFIFAGISAFCLGLLLMIGCIRASKYFYIYIIMLLKNNINKIRKQV